MKIHIKAKPGAKTAYVKKVGGDELFAKTAGGAGDHFVVAVKEKAVQGKANAAIERALAEYFKVPALRVRIVNGHDGQRGLVRNQKIVCCIIYSRKCAPRFRGSGDQWVAPTIVPV